MANCVTKHVPNALTCSNLVSGCIAVQFAFWGNYPMAFLFIVIGAVFDFFDGMSARLLGVSSPIGKELDSLADVVTFGVAPSAMVFTLLKTQIAAPALSPIGSYVPFAAFLMAAFSALRLAKFNLDARQATSFIGLPTPANALFWVTAAIVALVFVSSALLVAEIPMFALKFKHWGWQGNQVKYVFVITCIPLLLLLKWLGFAAIIAWYVILSVLSDKKS